MRPLSIRDHSDALANRAFCRIILDSTQTRQPPSRTGAEVVSNAAFMQETHRGADYFGQQWPRPLYACLKSLDRCRRHAGGESQQGVPLDDSLEHQSRV